MTATTLAPEQYFTVPGKVLSSDILPTDIWGGTRYKLFCLKLHNFLSLLSVSDWIPWLKFEHYKAK